MAKPLIPLEAILERALVLLDAQGSAALTTRSLAADLKISTRTLYQQVGSRDELIRALVARHFSELALDFHEYDDWEATALHWCLALRDALLAHPHLTELMTIDDRGAVMAYVGELVDATLREGVPRKLAIESCRSLVNLTISHSVMEVRGRLEPSLSRESAAETTLIEKNFPKTVGWILAGVRAEARQSTASNAKSVARLTKRRTQGKRDQAIG
ncbi:MULTISPECIES: TetR/AcrR family transcriptional regulator [unclassified Mycobacterium]|uniref:TetR/AcrR family transcriptional regulator n=1 Tax=unclassified Mycobacterium TaxID=2642494 RepID=UPI0029C7121D|nr:MULTISPECIES: TetR family transcriptional regulator [unclassified Mycobacterium]